MHVSKLIVFRCRIPVMNILVIGNCRTIGIDTCMIRKRAAAKSFSSRRTKIAMLKMCAPVQLELLSYQHPLPTPLKLAKLDDGIQLKTLKVAPTGKMIIHSFDDLTISITVFSLYSFFVLP